MIINITVLTYATRFDGTRLITIMLLACISLLVWDYDRLKYILPIAQTKAAPALIKQPPGNRLRIMFFGSCVGVIAFIIIGTSYLYKIMPGNSEEECRNQCHGKNSDACKVFCDCIYKQGKPLNSSLSIYEKAKN